MNLMIELMILVSLMVELTVLVNLMVKLIILVNQSHHFNFHILELRVQIFGQFIWSSGRILGRTGHSN